LRGVERWEENWRVIAPTGARRVRLPRGSTERKALARELRALPAGSPVVLLDRPPRGSARCALTAEQAGVALERSYLAFPSASAPAYLVEDVRATIAAFVRGILAVPPGSRTALPLRVALQLLRLPGAWRLLRVVAPGRLAVGRRA
jgi:hypothetical protein